MITEQITDRIDNITHVSEEYLHEVLPAPKSVKIELTQRCNYRCAFCALTLRPTSTDDLDMALFKRMTREMREAGVTEIGMFYIGESFTLIKQLVEGIEYVKQELQMPYVFLTTNGSLANAEAVQKVMAAGLDSLKWSVTSSDPDEFAKIVQVSPRMFWKSLANLKEARRIRDTMSYKTKIYASSIKYDDQQQGKMEDFLNEHVRPYVDQHYWLPLYSFGDSTGEVMLDRGKSVTAGNKGRVGGFVDPLPCWCVFTEGHVCANGHLAACGFDATGRFSMADLNEVSFMEGWNSMAFQKLRKAHLAKDVSGTECEHCVLYAG